MDTLLGKFLEQEYDQLDIDQKVIFERLLDEADPDIYAWILGYATLPNPAYKDIIKRLQSIHVVTAQSDS